MATSGSINYSLSRNQIITTALQNIGVYGIGRTVSAEDLSVCNTHLNVMIKSWQSKGLYLWKKGQAYLFLSKNVGTYTLGSSTAYARCSPIEDVVINRLNGSLAALATSVTVNSTTGMAINDNIGIPLTNGSIHWTTITNVNSSVLLTINTGVATAASDNAPVYTFTNRIDKPSRILDITRCSGIDEGTTSDRSEIPLTQLSYSDYFNLPNKYGSSGTISQWMYNPENSSGTLSVWPRPSDSLDYLMLSYEKRIEDFDSASNDADFPSEWLEALIWQLSVRICSAFGKEAKLASIAPLASAFLENALNYGQENASIQFMPDNDR